MSRLVLFITIIFAAALIASAQDLVAARRSLMPVPAGVVWKSGRLAVTKDFTVALAGKTDERLKAYVSRAMRRLEGRTLLELSRDFAADAGKASLLIETASTGSAIPQLGDDESYTLDIDDKQARLKAPTTVGAMRGLETFLQLLEGDRAGFYLPAVAIKDRPRFAWRGLLIDSARHFQPVEVIKRNLDALAAVKMNVLHWHLTEDQGFRVESKKFPELHTMGSDGLFYTQEQIRDIIRYAADRGIRVMPEFDMPGHATSWVVSHPEIASLPGPYQIERRPGIFDPTLDPTNEQTYKLLEVFFAEMAGLFPDKYMHIGGDENEGKQWAANPKIQAFMKEKGLKNQDALQQYFNQRILKFIQKNGKIMMGWDEIFQPDIPKNIVIQSWRGQESLAKVSRQGNQGILSNGYYIDLMNPASEHYAVDPLPANTTLSAEEQKRVLGGEATMWAEWVSPETIDSRIWPRTAAIAERLWSPREVTEVDDMYRRLDTVSTRLEELGLTHRRNQAMLLRRLAGGTNINALETLLSVAEPVKGYRRYQVRPQTMLSPLTGLIDAAQADAPGARIFNKAVDELIARRDVPQNALLIEKMLGEWRAAGDDLKDQTENSPALAEARQLAADFTALARIARAAFEDLKLRRLPTAASSSDRPAGWRDAHLKALDEIAKQKAGLELVVVDAVRKMVVEVSEK
ncbi:MAG: family 20 glycosylhydrolase [Acidobacteria bacterium]|nr:family 20 glycosylhydrolase [Acidobacteriota bacterium]